MDNIYNPNGWYWNTVEKTVVTTVREYDNNGRLVKETVTEEKFPVSSPYYHGVVWTTSGYGHKYQTYNSSGSELDSPSE